MKMALLPGSDPLPMLLIENVILLNNFVIYFTLSGWDFFVKKK